MTSGQKMWINLPHEINFIHTHHVMLHIVYQSG